jgi:hypothetical protein
VRKRIGRPSPALAISLIALFVALGGTGYAAITINGKNIKNNSIPGKKLKNGAVTGKKLKSNAVTGPKVKAGSLDSTDFKAGTLLQGPQGAPGVNGVNGAATVTYRTFVANTAGAGTLGEAEATCNAGEKLIGGGGGWVNNAVPPTAYVLDGTVSDSAPSNGGDDPIAEGVTPGAWHVSGLNTSGGSARMMAYAVCATP